MELPIYSERITLRAIQETDAHDIFSYRSLQEVARFQYWEPFNIEKAKSFAISCSSPQTNKYGEWIGLAIITEGQFIGDCSLKFEKHFAEVGCNISPKFQGFGYAKDTLNILLSIAFEDSSIDEVIAITDSENLASIKLLESLGMTKVLDFKNQIICKGSKCIEYKYSIERTVWNNTKNG
ncbi:GNAT family N-acetyltransferase [Dysgonomonas sp. Marseille-P4677]|nr:GNAT family N-acetyltransferase [Dysgonomonas sp. Marseille-P4677]